MGSAIRIDREVLEAVSKTCLIGAPTTETTGDAWSWPLRQATTSPDASVPG